MAKTTGAKSNEKDQRAFIETHNVMTLRAQKTTPKSVRFGERTDHKSSTRSDVIDNGNDKLTTLFHLTESAL